MISSMTKIEVSVLCTNLMYEVYKNRIIQKYFQRDLKKNVAKRLATDYFSNISLWRSNEYILHMYYKCFFDDTKTVLFTPFCSREKALILIACQKIQFGLVWRCNAFKFSEAKLLNKSWVNTEQQRTYDYLFQVMLQVLRISF